MLNPLPRRLEPEWLDELPGDDPRAVRSRRDLRLMNRIMGHAGIIAAALCPNMDSTAAPRIAELGAGDGTLLLRIAADAPWRTGAAIVLVDRQPVVDADTAARYGALGSRMEVCADDVFEWLGRDDAQYDAIIANLFLHHFENDGLVRLFALAAPRTRLFVGCEPRRARLPLAGSHLLGLIGCNDVTRHDAVLSVRSGFAARELSALWPANGGWSLEERRAGLFSHLFVARCVERPL
jgi:hypothetical protein